MVSPLRSSKDAARVLGNIEAAGAETGNHSVTARPASYLNKAALARELSMAESTVDDLVKRGVLPKPIRLSSHCVRWSWTAVELALASLSGTTDDAVDPFMQGARNATKTESRREPA